MIISSKDFTDIGMCDKLEDTIVQPAKQMQLSQFMAPLLMGFICGAALIAGEVMFYSQADSRFSFFLAFAVPIVILISATSLVGAGICLVISLFMLLFKSKRSLAIQLIISALCTGVPIGGALYLSQESLLSHITKDIPPAEHKVEQNK